MGDQREPTNREDPIRQHLTHLVREVKLHSPQYLDLCFHVLNGVGRLDLQGDGLPRKRLHEYLHPATKPENEVESRFLLDVVIRQSAAILQLLAGEDQPLLVRRDSLLVLHRKR